MAEDIREGDWISYPESEGQFTGVLDDSYGVRPKGTRQGQTVLVAKGDRVKKIALAEEE